MAQENLSLDTVHHEENEEGKKLARGKMTAQKEDSPGTEVEKEAQRNVDNVRATR